MVAVAKALKTLQINIEWKWKQWACYANSNHVTQPPPQPDLLARWLHWDSFYTEKAVVTVCALSCSLIVCATCPAWNGPSSLFPYLTWLFIETLTLPERLSCLVQASVVPIDTPSSESLLHFLFISHNSVVFNPLLSLLGCEINSAVSFGVRSTLVQILVSWGDQKVLELDSGDGWIKL